MKLGPRGEALIKSFETLRLEAYHGEADPSDIWTIGWGHTKTAKPGQVISEQVAQALFEADTQDAQKAVNAGIKAPTTQSQFDAFVSLAYNIGDDGIGGSEALAAHNRRAFFTAAKAILNWLRSNGKKRRGLLRRRCQEAALYAEDAWQGCTDD